MKLSNRQNELINCLSISYQTINDICDKFAKIQKQKGISGYGYIFKKEVELCLKSLIIKRLVISEDKKKFKLNK